MTLTEIYDRVVSFRALSRFRSGRSAKLDPTGIPQLNLDGRYAARTRLFCGYVGAIESIESSDTPTGSNLQAVGLIPRMHGKK